MIMDGIIGIIMIVSIARGKHKGFSDTFIKVILLLFAVLLGAFFTGNFGKILHLIHLDNIIDSKFDLSVTIPKGLYKGIFGKNISDAASSVISFFIIFISAWIIASIIRRKFSKARSKNSIIGSADKLAGMIFGFIKGSILIFVLLALMFPLSLLLYPGFSDVLKSQLGDSIFTMWLYDNNPLYLLFDIMHI